MSDYVIPPDCQCETCRLIRVLWPIIQRIRLQERGK